MVDRLAHIILVLIFIAGCGALVAPNTGSSRVGKYFVYVTNQGSSNISIYEMNTTTGDLTETTGSKASTHNAIEGMKAHPNGKYLYVGDNPAGANDPVLVFSIGDGTLSEIQSEASNGSLPWHFAFHPNGDHLYVGDVFSDEITHFTLDPNTGFITFQAVIASVDISRIVVDPSGSYLYAGKSTGTAAIEIFDIAGDGSLSVNATSPEAHAPANNSMEMLLHPTLDVLYNVLRSGANGLPVFTINTGNGDLTPLDLESPTDSPERAAMTSDGTNLALIRDSGGDSKIEMFSISGADGSLTSQNTTTVTGSTDLEAMEFGPNNKFLYVVDRGNAQVLRYTRSGNTLSDRTVVGTTGTAPYDLEIVNYSP